jgi:hypothetical protein
VEEVLARVEELTSEVARGEDRRMGNGRSCLLATDCRPPGEGTVVEQRDVIDSRVVDHGSRPVDGGLRQPERMPRHSRRRPRSSQQLCCPSRVTEVLRIHAHNDEVELIGEMAQGRRVKARQRLNRFSTDRLVWTSLSERREEPNVEVGQPAQDLGCDDAYP